MEIDDCPECKGTGRRTPVAGGSSVAAPIAESVECYECLGTGKQVRCPWCKVDRRLYGCFCDQH